MRSSRIAFLTLISLSFFAFAEETEHPKHHQSEEGPDTPLMKLDFDQVFDPRLYLGPDAENRPEGRRYIKIYKEAYGPNPEKESHVMNPIFDPRAVEHTSRLGPKDANDLRLRMGSALRNEVSGLRQPIDFRWGKAFEPENLFQKEFDDLQWKKWRIAANTKPYLEIAALKYAQARSAHLEPERAELVSDLIVLTGKRFEKDRLDGKPLPNPKEFSKIATERLVKFGVVKGVAASQIPGAQLLAEGLQEVYEAHKEWKAQEFESTGQRYGRAVAGGTGSKEDIALIGEQRRLRSTTNG